MPEYPDAVGPRRPRSPERQGPPRLRPEYDYFHDVDYLDYFDYGRDDYFDYFGYFPSGPKTMAPNPKFLDPMCDPNPKPLYHIYIRIL